MTAGTHTRGPRGCPTQPWQHCYGEGCRARRLSRGAWGWAADSAAHHRSRREALRTFGSPAAWISSRQLCGPSCRSHTAGRTWHGSWSWARPTATRMPTYASTGAHTRCAAARQGASVCHDGPGPISASEATWAV
eukprot:s172_g3.t1